MTYEWNLNTQYEFLPSWVLEVGYVGSHGIHQVTPGAVSGPTPTEHRLPTPYNVAQLVGVGAPCVSCGITASLDSRCQGNTTANAILRVPYLGVAATATTNQTNSNYKYNGLQVTLRKQFSKRIAIAGCLHLGPRLRASPAGRQHLSLHGADVFAGIFRPATAPGGELCLELALGPSEGLPRQGDGWLVLVGCNHHPGRRASRHRGQFGRRIFGVIAGLAGTIRPCPAVPGNDGCKHRHLRQHQAASNEWVTRQGRLDQLGSLLRSSHGHRSGQRRG